MASQHSGFFVCESSMGPSKHIGQQACEQEELRGFTKKQVYDKRNSMSRAGLVPKV